MIRSKSQLAAILLSASTVFCAAPRESQAIFHWFRGCGNWCGQPTYANYGCYSCAPQPVQAQYVPQTCYRTQYVSVPVTSYRPVTSCDPCTGCAQTCMRPVTTYMYQARLVPYTSYRIVYSNPCNTCPTGACGQAYAPTSYYQPSSPSCCSAAPAAAEPAAPTDYYEEETPQPTLSDEPLDSSAGSSGSAPQQQSAARPQDPIPDAEASEDAADDGPAFGPTSTPQLIDPDSRTAAAERGAYTRVVWPQRRAAPQPPIPVESADGWRASNR